MKTGPTVKLTTLIAAVACVASLARAESLNTKEALKVFILAGQSNMEGHGNVELTPRAVEQMRQNNTYERDKNNYLDYLAKESEKKDRYRHLLDAHGQWARRDDVWFIWQRGGRDSEEIKSKLTIGLGAGGSPKIGPELQFGHVMGDTFEAPVLLIKTAWGGKSLAIDFRPPKPWALRLRMPARNARSSTVDGKNCVVDTMIARIIGARRPSG